MAHGDFVWCDLSTFDVDRTKHFYRHLFGWDYRSTTQPDGAAYHIALVRNAESAGIFQMPQRFEAMGLPSFWMSYIAVDDAAACVAAARVHGGTVEVGPIPFGDGAQIALIRDPLGAGFTVHQGSGMEPRLLRPAPGHMAWNALYVTDPAKVVGFYRALFGWRIARAPDANGSHAVTRAGAGTVAEIQTVPEALTDGFEFWGVHFACSDLPEAAALVSRTGGKIVYRAIDTEPPMAMARDPDGAAFFLVPAAA